MTQHLSRSYCLQVLTHCVQVSRTDCKWWHTACRSAILTASCATLYTSQPYWLQVATHCMQVGHIYCQLQHIACQSRHVLNQLSIHLRSQLVSTFRTSQRRCINRQSYVRERSQVCYIYLVLRYVTFHCYVTLLLLQNNSFIFFFISLWSALYDIASLPID